MNRLCGTRVYLCGSIDAAPDGGKQWRENITPFFHNLGIGVFDPTNKPVKTSETKDYVQFIANLKREGKYNEVRKRVAEIVTTDLMMLDLSDFIFVYLDMSFHHCGTYSEITYAALEKKPIIIVCKQGKSEIPSWLFGMGLRHEMFFDSFDAAKDYISHIHFSSSIDDLGRWRFIDYGKVFKCSM